MLLSKVCIDVQQTKGCRMRAGMKLGLCRIAFRETSLEDVLDIAADYGFDGVEIWGQAPHIPPAYDAEYVKRET